MTQIMDDFDYVRAALRRLNSEAYEADRSWHALNRIQEQLAERLSICAYCGVAFEWDGKGDSCPGCKRANYFEDQYKEKLELYEEARAEQERLRIAAREYLSVPSGSGDWTAEEQALRQKLSEALNGGT